jgi:hypothetical protein
LIRGGLALLKLSLESFITSQIDARKLVFTDYFVCPCQKIDLFLPYFRLPRKSGRSQKLME